MTYSVGSGDYVALMAAVLAHAITDGWTTSGGTWPISKGNVRGVNWSTYTTSEQDFTALSGANRTNRIIRIAIGTSLANATANAALDANSARVPNMDRTFTNWWIFSDPGVGKPDYIHVVFQFSNGINNDCFGHFSFGEIDRHGMTHGPTTYATTSPVRGYANNGNSGFFSQDWNGMPHGGNFGIFQGHRGNGNSYAYLSHLSWLQAAPSPYPSALSGWLAIDALGSGTRVLSTYSSPADRTNMQSVQLNGINQKLASFANWTAPQPYSGAISFGPLPFIALNTEGNESTSNGVVLGSFPDVRFCNLNGYNAGDEVIFGSETWKVFPILRNTPQAQISLVNTVSSGRAGYAYKKVT